jgi:hypothetical protein
MFVAFYKLLITWYYHSNLIDMNISFRWQWEWKNTLIAKLQGVEDPKKGSGLEFAYIDVRDDYRDG